MATIKTSERTGKLSRENIARAVGAVTQRPCALPECGVVFTPQRSSQKFHSPQCAKIAANRRSKSRIAPPEQVDAIAELERQGYVVHKPRPIETPVLDVSGIVGRDRLRLAVVSCTHFGSKYQQLTALREFCQYADRVAKVDLFVHGGDLTDGPFGRHKNPHEVFKHDYEAVLSYASEALPRTRKPWKIISGNHDDWYTLDGGPDIIRALCERRDDCEYLGASLGYFNFKDTLIEVTHLNTGSAYAYSYKPQKHVESLSPERKPHMAIIANFHKFCALYYRNVLALQVPSFQAQTPWMAGKSLVSEVGGIIVEIGATTKGLTPSTKFEVVYSFEPRENDWP